MPVRIALAGNPNSGKTTLFNALTGSNQFVGNWPGVTVEKKEGRFKNNRDVVIVDLPGIYSLSPYSLEEVVSRDFLVDERPDVILNIIDGTNLERNLYLTTQLTEIGIPIVAAVNMMDAVAKSGAKIHAERLSKALGCAVVEVSALRETGIDEAVAAALEAAKRPAALPPHRFSGSVEHALAHIEEYALHDLPDEKQRWYAVKLFERDAKVAEKIGFSDEARKHIETDIARCEKELDDDSESIITSERYNYIESVIKECRTQPSRGVSVSDRIDSVLTNRWLALPIFAAIIFIVYFVSVTTVGAWVTGWTNNTLFGEIVPVVLGGFLESVNCAEWLSGLILEGIVAGVGAVLGFVPQMFVLFMFLAFLEACGYMSRIAFILDRIFRKFGLSGKSFIPILVGTGCGVPGIMASRTIENESDRRMTVITTTFIPCSAKLPVIALISGALFGGAWWVAPSAYFMGMAAIVVSGIILKKTRMFAGDAAPFVLELPPYHMPTAINVLRSMWERGWSFIKKAGSIILISSVALWFMSRFGWSEGAFGMLAEESMDGSILAYIGSAIAWVFAPLGFGDWRSAVATLTGLLAKENIVGTFGILYGFGGAAGEGALMWETLARAYSPGSAYALMAFNLLCVPCAAAVGAISREMNSAKWLWFALGYQTAFAYVAALCVNQFAIVFTGGSFSVWSAVAAACAALAVWLLARRGHGEKGSVTANAKSGKAAV